MHQKRMVTSCLLVTLQEGEYILKEGEPLATKSKFYIIEEGAVECCKTIQVRIIRGAHRFTLSVVTLYPFFLSTWDPMVCGSIG